MAQLQRIVPVESVDPIWARIRSEAEAIVRQEPQLASFIYASLLEHESLTGAAVQRISDRLDHPVLTGTAIRQAFLDALADSPEIGDAFRADIVATYDRDPATTRFIEPVLYFKGFHAIQTYRLAHWLWGKHRKDFALYLQSRCFRPTYTPQRKSGAAFFSITPPGLWSARPRSSRMMSRCSTA
jgi:serine O-acetyltransferase